MASLSENTAGCSQALQTLAKLGRSDDASPALTEASDDLAATVPVHQLDESRSDNYKLTQIAKTYISVMSTLERRLTAAANAATTQYQQDAAAVFGTAGLKGDAATLVIARRDASERVTNENDSIKLQRLLTDAALHGDDTLAHAIVEKAINMQDQGTTEIFQSLYPSLADATSRLWNSATRKFTGTDIITAMSVPALKPGLLKPLQDYEIESAAAGNANAGSWNA